MGIFSTRAIVPQNISDRSPLPAGAHNVSVLDVIEMMQSDDITIKGGKIIIGGKKPSFDMAFDQEILCILLGEIGGDRYIVDRLSLKGWLNSSDVDPVSGELIMTEKKAKEYGLKPTDTGRYTDEFGNGVENPFKSATCERLLDEFGTVCSVEVATDSIDAELKILVKDSKPYYSEKAKKMVTNTEVGKYLYYDENLLKTTVANPVADQAPVQQEPIEQPVKRSLFGAPAR